MSKSPHAGKELNAIGVRTLGLFEKTAWPEAEPELAVRGASQAVRVAVRQE
jgi:hypothetical protein